MNVKLLINTSFQNMQKYLYDDLYNLEEIHWWHKAKRNLVSYVMKQNLSGNQNKILDVGCGTGKNLESFTKFGNTWGIDSAKEAVDYCRKRGIKNITLGNLEKIPFNKESFDCITALDVLEHVDDSKAIRELERVLKKSGILIITVPAFPMLWSRWDEVLHHKRRYTKETLKRVLQKNELKVMKISYIYSFLFFPAFIIRLIKKAIYQNHYPSDFKLSNKIVNYLLGSVAAAEKFLVINSYIPFGTSLIAVVKKYQ